MKFQSIFCQLLQMFPRYDFEKAVRETRAERHARGVRCWDQFVAMLFCHFANAKSLREITGGLASQEGLMYHLGMRPIGRSTLSYANAHRPWELYRTVFYQLMARCQSLRTGHKFRFHNPLLSMDSTLVELCAGMIDWAKYSRTKGAVKLHLVLDHDGYLPTFAHISDWKTSDLRMARLLQWEPGSIVVFDRGYLDFAWLGQLHRDGVWFVTRAKSNMNFKVVEHLDAPKNRHIISDVFIQLGDYYSHQSYPYPLRLVCVENPDGGEPIRLLSNHPTFGASTISAIYKDRWRIELFFKAIKQNLRIKTFVGTTPNALHIQIWTALISYLLLWYMKAQSRFGWSLSNLVALLRMNLSNRKDFWLWLNDPFPDTPPSVQYLSLFPELS